MKTPALCFLRLSLSLARSACLYLYAYNISELRTQQQREKKKRRALHAAQGWLTDYRRSWETLEGGGGGGGGILMKLWSGKIRLAPMKNAPLFKQNFFHPLAS